MAKTSRHTHAIDYEGERTGGVIFGTLHWSDIHGEGDAKMKFVFDEMPPVMRLDALGDAIGMLEREYEYQMQQFYGSQDHPVARQVGHYRGDKND